MFAPIRDWQPSADAWAELWEQDDEIVEFTPSFEDFPGAASAALFENVDPASLTDSDVIDAMAGWGRLASWAQARQSAVIAEFAKRRPPEWLDDDEATVNRFATEEIACALSLTVRGAGNRLELAQRLDEALPETRNAWESGELDWPRVNVIAERTMTLTPEQSREVEREILSKVANKTTGQIRRVVDRAVISADPDAANARHEAARHERDVTVRPIEDGMALLTATLCIEEAAAAERVLNELAGKSGGRADAFMRLVTGDAKPVPTGKPSIQVIVAASTLAGLDDQFAEIPGWGLIPPDAARRIAADGMWQRILTDPVSGTILDVGRTRYRPPKALVDYVKARDRVCAFPPCRKSADNCDLDHRIPYSRGGETSADNLQALCPRHHELKHNHGWTVHRQSDGTTVWTAPTGHTYPNEPEMRNRGPSVYRT